MTSTPEQLCCICGIRPSTTVEHIPPQCVFPSPRPTNTITVPACEECNESTSKEDEEFRVVVSLFAGKKTCVAQHLWETRTLPTLKNNNRLLNRTKVAFQPGYLTSQGGIILEAVPLVVWDGSRIKKVIEKIVRGLYYYHYKEILADRVDVSIDQVETLTMEKVEFLKRFPSNRVGDCQFLYVFDRAKTESLASFWFLMFQKALMVVCKTIPK